MQAENVSTLLAGWEDFYVIVGSSGAALVGLQFVVLTLIADRRSITRTTRESVNTFGTPTVVHFSGALIISAIMSAPWPSLGGVDWALRIAGGGGLVYALIVTLRARRQSEYTADPEDWLWFIILPWVIYGGVVVASFFLVDHMVGALFAIGAAVLGLLCLGIRNAWDTVMYVVVSGPDTTS